MTDTLREFSENNQTIAKRAQAASESGSPHSTASTTASSKSSRATWSKVSILRTSQVGLVGRKISYQRWATKEMLASPFRTMTSTKESRKNRQNLKWRSSSAAPAMSWFVVALAACLIGGGSQLFGVVAGADDLASAQRQHQQQIDPRSTQPTLDRQLESPSSSSSASSSSVATSSSSSSSSIASVNSAPQKSAASDRQHEQARAAKPQKPAASSVAKKAAALAAQRDYDKYQLKASGSANSQRFSSPTPADSTAATTSKPNQSVSGQSAEKEREKALGVGNNNSNSNKPKAGFGAASEASSSVEPAHKKIGQLPNTRPHPKASSSFSLLRKFFPSFMTSAAAAAAAASAAAAADKPHHQNQHSRSSPSTSNSLLSSLLSSSGSSAFLSSSAPTSPGGQSSSSSSSAFGGLASAASEGAGSSPLTGKIINLLTGTQKKKGLTEGVSSAIPNQAAPFFMRKSAADRQAAGGNGALALASGLLANPLKLGLLFSAPLLPSLLLTPLAIAGLSPAMSAINNLFGDDEEPSSSQSPLSTQAGGSFSPLASILQATGASPFASSSDSSSGSSGTNSLALQAFQSFLVGPTSTTERPLFKPGMFASSGIQNAAGAINAALSSSGQQSASGGSSGSQSSSSSNNNQRPFFGSGGGFIQTAASMISPSFAAPPSSSNSGGGSGSGSEDDGPGLMQMASDVFEKVATYMGTEGNKDGTSQAASAPPSNSPLSALASLSSMSPFQLSSLFAGTPLGSAALAPASGSSSAVASSSSSSIGNKNQRAGFFSTLRNVYELFSSSFLRRQEVGNENECQQRLVCELHQRAMNSKMFRRSLQSNLAELANLDKNLIEQIKYNAQTIQARVDPETKAMLNDFLKATNNFKSGREMINCSQMFPKCTRTQLLAAANAHLSDPVNGRAIGKFSQLMKKMKFKANQQHQSQWKLRKPGKSLGQITGPANGAARFQPIDHLQVAPLSPMIPSSSINSASSGQLMPVDSLKLSQQIMMLSQLNQQQQQQQHHQSQQQSTSSPNQYAQNSFSAQQQQQLPAQDQQFSQSSVYGQQQMLPSYQQSGSPLVSVQQSQLQQQQQPNYSRVPQQYSPAPKQQATYTDAIIPAAAYGLATESPYFISQINSGVGTQQQQMGSLGDQQQAPQFYSQQQQQSQLQPMGSISQQQGPYLAQDQSAPQEQQPGRGLNMDNKNKPQQLITPNKQPVAAAAA